MSKIVRVGWTEHEEYHAYLLVPDDWNDGDYDLENAMAEWSDEDHDDGIGSRQITSVEEVPEIVASEARYREEPEEADSEFWEAYRA